MKNDIIHTTVKIRFSRVHALRILFGGVAVVDVEIETDNEEVIVVRSTAKTHVGLPSWFPRKKSKGEEVLISDCNS